MTVKVRIAYCRSCGEPLHKLVVVDGQLGVGTELWTKQCLNHNCKKYGVPV